VGWFGETLAVAVASGLGKGWQGVGGETLIRGENYS